MNEIPNSFEDLQNSIRKKFGFDSTSEFKFQYEDTENELVILKKNDNIKDVIKENINPENLQIAIIIENNKNIENKEIKDNKESKESKEHIENKEKKESEENEENKDNKKDDEQNKKKNFLLNQFAKKKAKR